MTAPLESSVIRIYSASKTVVGAGFLVSDNQVLTCAHVVAFALGIRANSPERPETLVCLDFPLIAPGKLLSGRVIFWKPVNPNELEEDLAVLQLESPIPETAFPIKLVTADDFWGHSFRVFGFPKGQPMGVYASGVLRGKTAKSWVHLEDIKEPGFRLEEGFSGAPVWDEQLQGIAGIAVAAEKERPDVKGAFIIPTNLLIQAWPELSDRTIAQCPYRGLFAFREEDARFFFGREGFIQQIVQAVEKRQFVAVIGPSGSGKSSVVFAGLIPQLRLQQKWAIASFRPKAHPFDELARALVGLKASDRSEIEQDLAALELSNVLQSKDSAIETWMGSILEKHSGSRLLLVVDQFEELYTLSSSQQTREKFLDRLLCALQNIPDFSLVLTLRADFLGYALSYRPFADALQGADVKLGPMKGEELYEAIAHPAKLLGVRLQPGLGDRLLEDVEKSPGNLPLLEFALEQLWVKQENAWLTHHAYEAFGGVEKVLAHYAQEIYDNLSPSQQEQTEKLFIQLVHPGEGTEDTRQVLVCSHCASLNPQKCSLVRDLASRRLIVTGYQEATGNTTIEIVHEALIREWDTLRQWMEANRAFRIWQERLKAKMHEWERMGRDEEELLSNNGLAEAEKWREKRLEELSDNQRIFIQLSLAKQEMERKLEEDQKKHELMLERRAKRLAQSVAGILGAIVLYTSSLLLYPKLLSWQTQRDSEMITISTGVAIIGTNIPDSTNEERPESRIRLPAFRIDKYEVSNRLYARCVRVKKCSEPTDSINYHDPNKSDRPVVGITPKQAADYCRWLGRRLPSHLEWERAARGSEGFKWPWGNEDLTANHANVWFIEGSQKETEPISTYHEDRSPEGVVNLAGNVREWTSSIYPQDDYQNPDRHKVWDGLPQHLKYKLIIKGGGWETSLENISSIDYGDRTYHDLSLGMRCVRSH
ncbi:nSTAND1 domain-containing NTPase [Oxynema aestuarii]|uniref:SUMF1/EgtB/PvdO family nonheme iron enzyme n=1 Tax=Oxynema aestuarii AP17 TaxID=2064643 RepID=A0A6H1U2D3_9CYAN|nr:SUMF1/EgtB/PvdO family nonheme iron enzyme [Oxynema aestuarii]QIZ72606.1 SUMF1/EgtB/PvdO family nonheme iron enzyme [Oxynema aestuarii AP17]